MPWHIYYFVSLQLQMASLEKSTSFANLIITHCPPLLPQIENGFLLLRWKTSHSTFQIKNSIVSWVPKSWLTCLNYAIFHFKHCFPLWIVKLTNFSCLAVITSMIWLLLPVFLSCCIYTGTNVPVVPECDSRSRLLWSPLNTWPTSPDPLLLLLSLLGKQCTLRQF
jgi:hypothetical protein